MTTDAARILVVEDNADTSALLRDLLEAEGYDVASVATGEAAFEALAVTPDIDLVVLDLMLPGMSGYEVIERMRALPELADLPVLVLSALSSPSARVRGLREGADDYMTKPFLPEEIVARARTLVMRRLLERRTAEMDALGRIAQAALTATSPEVLLQRVAEIAVDVFAADIAVIYMVDETRGELRPRAAVGLPADAEPAAIPLGAGVAATAIANREPVLIPDGAADDPRVVDAVVRREALRSLMVAPLVVAGAPIGVIEVARRARRLDTRADRLLRIVADRAAGAIHRRGRHRGRRRRSHRLRQPRVPGNDRRRRRSARRRSLDGFPRGRPGRGRAHHADARCRLPGRGAAAHASGGSAPGPGDAVHGRARQRRRHAAHRRLP
jgi:DNA-binding response OmpR family regulator